MTNGVVAKLAPKEPQSLRMASGVWWRRCDSGLEIAARFRTYRVPLALIRHGPELPPICKREGWVCADPKLVALDEGQGCCGAEGAPCRCNPTAALPPGFMEIANVHDEASEPEPN
jgi:hypothetical protein